MAVQRNTGMLGGPHRWIAAMCCLVRAAQFLASLPQTRRTVHPLRHDLPIDNEMHSAERMQGFVVEAPSGCSVRRCVCQWHRRVRPARTIPRHCSTPERSSLRSGGALARHRSVSAASSSEPPASVGLACRPVGAWRRQLVKQLDSMGGGPGTDTFSSAVDSRPLAGPERPGVRSGTRCPNVRQPRPTPTAISRPACRNWTRSTRSGSVPCVTCAPERGQIERHRRRAARLRSCRYAA